MREWTIACVWLLQLCYLLDALLQCGKALLNLHRGGSSSGSQLVHRERESDAHTFSSFSSDLNAAFSCWHNSTCGWPTNLFRSPFFTSIWHKLTLLTRPRRSFCKGDVSNENKPSTPSSAASDTPSIFIAWSKFAHKFGSQTSSLWRHAKQKSTKYSVPVPIAFEYVQVHCLQLNVGRSSVI